MGFRPPLRGRILAGCNETRIGKGVALATTSKRVGREAGKPLRTSKSKTVRSVAGSALRAGPPVSEADQEEVADRPRRRRAPALHGPFPRMIRRRAPITDLGRDVRRSPIPAGRGAPGAQSA